MKVKSDHTLQPGSAASAGEVNCTDQKRRLERTTGGHDMIDAVTLSTWTRDVQDPEMTPTGSTEYCSVLALYHRRGREYRYQRRGFG